MRVMNPTTQPHGKPDPKPVETDEEKAERVRVEARQLDRDLWSIVGHMAASLLVYGAIGYFLGRWLGHPILLLFGVLFGVTLSLGYTIWLVNRGGRLHR